MSLSKAQGQNPGPARVTPTADGRDPSAPADMSAACEAAQSAAISHAAAEGRKVDLS